MLYLEDYLEMIEHLPQELRDRFTEMRELDLSVHNSVDSIEKKCRGFFMRCKRGELSNEAMEKEYQNIQKEYCKVLEDADEKVVIATQIHDLVERYLKRLDSDLFKFKCELEADNNGITEILEKRSLEMDGNSSAAAALLNAGNVSQKENRYYGLNANISPVVNNAHNSLGSIGNGAGIGCTSISTTPTTVNKDNRYRTPRPEKRRNSTTSVLAPIPEKRANMGNNLTAGATPVAVVRPITPALNSVLAPTAGNISTPAAVTYNLQQIATSPTTAIAAAASQAIVATQQMQQGRRTASLKASYEAIHGAGGAQTEFWINRDVANAATTVAAQHTTITTTNSTEKNKKKYASKKLNSSLSQNVNPSNVVSPSSAALILGTSSSSVSIDSVDMFSRNNSNLSIPSMVGNGSQVTSSSTAVTNVNNAACRTSVCTTAPSVSTVSSSSISALTPGSNITLNENGMVVEQSTEAEWSYDPDEPRYCTCNQVSYGDMVACDNDACPYEWFHYPCVGITQPPKGKWYCPKCTVSMRRRNRKN